MDKAIIDVVCFQALELPFDAASDHIGIRAPSVCAGGIIRPKMDLVENFIPDPCKGLSIIWEAAG